MCDDSIKSLLLKIKRLADEGCDGEREAAQGKLKMLLARHNLTVEDLLNEELRWYEFFFASQREKKLLIQLYIHLCDSATPKSMFKDGKHSLFFNITVTEFADMADAFSHYKGTLRLSEKSLRKKQAAEKKMLLPSFIQVNKLFPRKEYNTGKGRDLTDAQRRALVAMMHEQEANVWSRKPLMIGG
jgi:hypothetical protein